MSKNSAKARYEQLEEWRKATFPESKTKRKGTRLEDYKNKNVK